LYEPHPEAALPPPADGSFACTLLFDDLDGANLQVDVIFELEEGEWPARCAGTLLG
jgi:hypothetical protein